MFPLLMSSWVSNEAQITWLRIKISWAILQLRHDHDNNIITTANIYLWDVVHWFRAVDQTQPFY